MFRKIILEGKVAQEKFLKGVDTVDKIVGGTLGPGGRNRIIQRKYKAPLVVNDGATIARHIVLDDPIEDMAAQTIIEISMKTAEQAGDGTTTSVVIASALTKKCMGILAEEGKKSILEGGAKTNPMQLWKQIQSEKDKAVEILKKNANPISEEDLDDVISTSLEDMEYGKTLGELLRTIGPDGYVSVEENWATKYGITTETTTGMRFLGKYATPYLATSLNKKEAVWNDSYILVTNHKLESVTVLQNILKELGEKGHRKLVIIGGFSEGAEAFSREFVESIARAMFALSDPKITNKGDIIQVLAIKAPSLTSPELEDVAAFCDAKFIDKSIGISLKTATLKDLGYANKISVTDDEVNIIGGRGNATERIAVLKAQVEKERDQMFKEKLLRRIASLSSGVGVIRVGANTESEKSYLKYKLEDAVLAAKAAREEGLVKGGGLALKEVAEELGTDSILYSALMAPFERIIENRGEEIDTPESVVDPLKVVRIALENACSGAGMLITSDGAIAEQKLDFMDYMEKGFRKLIPRDERDDWRDSENQDLGAGRFVD